MDSLDKEVLLESCCFLLNYQQEQSKRKRKRTWMQEIFLKRIEQGVYHNLLREMRASDGESYFRLLHNELFSESNEEKCAAFQSLAWSLTAQLLSKYFPSGLSLCILYFLFIKPRILLQSSAKRSDRFYVCPIFFRFHKCFNNFRLNKNILI